MGRHKRNGGQGVSKDTIRRAIDLSDLGKPKTERAEKKGPTPEEVMQFCRAGLSQLSKGYSGILNQIQQLQVEASKTMVRYRVIEKILLKSNLVTDDELDALMKEEQVEMVSEHIEITRYLRLSPEDSVLLARSKGVPEELCDSKILCEPLSEAELAALVVRNPSVAAIEAAKAEAEKIAAEEAAKAEAAKKEDEPSSEESVPTEESPAAPPADDTKTETPVQSE